MEKAVIKKKELRLNALCIGVFHKIVISGAHQSHLAVCDSVHETCNELGIERQTLHNVDGLTRYRLVIKDQIE